MSNKTQEETATFSSVDKTQKHTLSERHQMQKTTCCILPFLRNVWKRQMCKNRMQAAWSRLWEEGSLRTSLTDLQAVGTSQH